MDQCPSATQREEASGLQIELISIGSEILKGSVSNTNATFLLQHLFANGYEVSRQTAIPDTADAIRLGLKEALERASVVIATGGLGPTLDDLTKPVAAALFASEFYLDAQIAEDLRRRYGERDWIENQASVPVKAKALPNAVGTAPGLIFSENGKVLILLPGVPGEMQALFELQVLSFLREHFPRDKRKQTRTLFFMLLIESEVDPVLRELTARFPSVEMGIYPGLGRLSVTLSSSCSKELDLCVEALQNRFASYLFTSSNGRIERALQEWFLQNGKKLALAESCTGGLMAHLLTSVPGSSGYFLGSFVTYCDALKESALSVSPKTLEKEGAVSKKCVEEMLAGVFKASEADYAIAVTGIAGPEGGSAEKPVGTIWVALGKRGEAADVGSFLMPGERMKVLITLSNRLLGMLYQKVSKNISHFQNLR